MTLGPKKGRKRKLKNHSPLRRHGRPPHIPTETTRGFVEAMTAGGETQENIAKVVGVDPKTLRKHYAAELDGGSIKANALVAQSLHQNAIGGGKWQDANMSAAIWWSKARMGWHEPKQEIAHTGTIGTYDAEKLKHLSDAELTAFAAILARITPKSSAPDGSPSGD